MTSGEWSLVGGARRAGGGRARAGDGRVRGRSAVRSARSPSAPAALAAFLAGRGVGIRRERDELERWENGQDTVAVVLHNSVEYVEAMFGAFRARAVPFNVNQHYRPAEVGALLADLDTRAVVFHRALGPLVEAPWRRRRPRGSAASCSSTSTTGRASPRCRAAPRSRTRCDAGFGAPARDLARRPLPRVHRRHDRAPQGGAVAPGRHLRVGHGGQRGCHRRVDRGDRHRRRAAPGTRCRR